MVAGRHVADGPPDGEGFNVVEHVDHRVNEGAPKRRRKHRRVRTEPVPGSDPNPQPEPPRHADDENDDRLRADKPPHWG